MKPSKRVARRSMPMANRLYATTAGIAANRPIAVATNASAMPGAHRGERGLLDVGQAAERVHDAPDRAEQPDIRTDRTRGRQKAEFRIP